MMILVPVFPVDHEELMMLSSARSSSCVLKGECSRMSCRLLFCSSFTESERSSQGQLEMKNEDKHRCD